MEPLSKRETFVTRLIFAAAVALSTAGFYLDNGLSTLGLLGFLFIVSMDVGDSREQEEPATSHEGDRLKTGAIICVVIFFFIFIFRFLADLVSG